MKVYYQNKMANFIISRAFILLLISIFSFPLIILSTPTQQDLALLCHQELSPYEGPFSLLPDRKTTREAQIPLAKSSAMQTYTLSFLAWWTCPPRIPLFEQRKKKKSTPILPSIWKHLDLDRARTYLSQTCLQTLCRTLLFVRLWLSSPQWWPSWVVCLPALEWIANIACRAWPALACQPEVATLRGLLSNTRLITCWLLLLTIVSHWLDFTITGAVDNHDLGVISPLAGLVLSKPSPNLATNGKISISKLGVGQQEAYQINLSGHFYLTVDPANRFWTRMVIIFLRQLQSDSLPSAGRPTRDGRRPIVSQTRLAEAFGVTQPEISRWEKYWLDKDWPNLLSLKSAQLLTVELREQIVEVFARHPWWGTERVYQYLQQQGIKVTKNKIQQAAIDSGWRHLRQTLNRFFIVSPGNIRPRDEALVKQLLNQVEVLLEKVKNSDQLTPQEESEITDLQSSANELGIVSKPAKISFWGQKIKNVLFCDSSVSKVKCCTYCGSDKIRAKGTKGYQKRYLDENGQWQTVEVFPKYCDNPDCEHQTFTDLPEHLLPHSPYSLGIRLQAFYLVAVVGGSYRRVAAALGVKSSRVYEWVSAFGQELLPMAALFGVVRSSGVVGIDEKYVLVPLKAKRGEGATPNKNKKRRWMYVYLAVDVYTYDLLHIEIYEYNTQKSTHAFLLALKSKGYQPRVIVTDLRKEYGPAIKAVFKGARHHECIFHALQWWNRQMKDIYGANYENKHPEVVKLKEQLVQIFQTTSKRVAQKRYESLMANRETYVSQNAKAAAIFDSLERHWPKLVNAIESTIIPKTNNAVELVIRRFDQHYKNFCGFNSIESARTYLGVFEKAYRFTPFTDDARLKIRGKCPLELAGYDISRLPMTQICRGWVQGMLAKSAQELL